jgi:methylaspartate mutase sigma subunit
MTDCKGTIVTGVIGVDVHAVGNHILTFALKRAGYKVVNLSIMVTQEEFIKAAIETAADAILVSSLYGHAELDCAGLREKCIEAGIGDIRLYVGGNLTVGKADFQEVEARFKNLGFDRVAAPGTTPGDVIAMLNEDIC